MKCDRNGVVQSMKKIAGISLAAVLLASVMLLASCGDTNTPGGTGTESSTGTTAAIEPPKGDVTSRDNGDGNYEAGGYEFSNDGEWSKNY